MLGIDDVLAKHQIKAARMIRRKLVTDFGRSDNRLRISIDPYDKHSWMITDIGGDKTTIHAVGIGATQLDEALSKRFLFANPLADNVLALRTAVIRARTAYHRGELPLEAVYVVVDEYIAATEVKFKRLWPTKRYRKPSRAYLLRAL